MVRWQIPPRLGWIRIPAGPPAPRQRRRLGEEYISSNPMLADAGPGLWVANMGLIHTWKGR